MSRRTLLLLAIGIAGYAFFAALFPRFSTASQWRLRLDQSQSIARARAVAAEHGVDVTGWPEDSAVRVTKRLQEELGADGKQAAQVHVAFRDPRESDNAVGVRLDTSGRPTAFIVKRERRPGDDVAADAVRPIAERAFHAFVPDAASYQSVAEEDLGDGGVRFRWERGTKNARVIERATAIVAGSDVRDLRYGPELVKSDTRPIDIVDNVSDAAVILGVLFGLVLFIIAASRGLVPLRLALTIGAICWLLLAIELRSDLDPTLLALFYASNASARWTLIVGSLIIAAIVGLALTGAYPSARRRFPLRLVAFEELLLRGRLTSRSVGVSLLVGVAAGGWIAAIPHLLRATGLFGTYLIGDGSDDVLLRSGLLPIDVYAGVIPSFLAFALLVSFVEDKAWARAGRALGFALAFVVLLDDAVTPLAPAILAGILVTLLFDALFRRIDLLALIAGGASAAWAIAAASRLVQPSPSIQHDGWIAVGAGAIVTITALAIALRGSTKPYLPWEPRPARAERERIQAEFEVARLAQEQMLPRSAPELPATSIASFCRPARQVGGDLFDFVTMSDGTVGITVADVSGKGVPAALVMTITKGLLLAASDGRSDPLETLADVNAGIHSLGHRSVFVTMLFGVFDPVARTFHFVRAGHTPLLWRKTSGAVAALAPRGIGVGMTSPLMFSKICERSTITTGTGDFLILYSDGITEAMNAVSEEFGDERLFVTVRDRITNGMTAEEARVVIIEAVDEFRGDAPVHDDMTLVVVKC